MVYFRDDEDMSAPGLRLIIPLDCGYVNDIVWCSNLTGNGNENLGYIAAACSDGSIRIFRITLPEKSQR